MSHSKFRRGEKLFVGYVLVGLLSWPLIAGMLYPWYHAIDCRSSWREDAGTSVALSMVGVVLWPALLPAAYFITGFAEHGFGPWNDCRRAPQENKP